MFSANRVSIFRYISASFQFSRPSYLDFEFRQNCGNFHQILRHFGKLEAKNSIQQKRTINMANLYEGRIIPQIQMGQIDEQPRIGHFSNEFKLNGKEAFKSKSNFDLIRGLFVFRCCQFDWLVQNNQQILNGMQKILGTQLFNRLLKMTFYGHFVAGETLDEVKIAQNINKKIFYVSKTVSKLQQFGVQSILDYSVEQDIGQSNSKNEKEEFDKNVEIFCQCIDSTAKATNGKGFTVLKLTALGPPELLIRLTEIIEEKKKLFNILAGKDGQIEGKNLQKQFQNIGIKMDEANMQKLLEQIEMPQNGIFDKLEWENSVGFDNGNLNSSNNIFNEIEVMNMKTGRSESLLQNLTEKEQKECAEMNDRLIQIAEYAKEKGILLMIDAEQTYFQPAISQFAISLMKRFNKENAQIFNTYQAYLRNGLSNLLADMNLARRENFHFGCKLVRGAYMEQERKMATQNGQMDPINGTYEETSKMYYQCLEAILDEWEVRGRNKVSAMVASHNLETIKFAMELMRQKGIQPGDNVLSFGQLYGMSDAISFTQAQFGYNIFKYIPWGPVQGVLPYLSRRALENGAMLQKVGEERQMLLEELKRRIGNWEWAHRPTMKIEGGKIEPRPMKIAPQIVN